MRGITSTVDIIWTTNNTQVRRINNVTASSNIISTSIYNDSFIILLLNLSDIGSVYQCEVLINSVLPTSAKTDFIVPIPGNSYVYVLSIYTYMSCCFCLCIANVSYVRTYNILTGSRCLGNSIKDVMFVIDTSGSIGSSNFQLIREFTANITAELIRDSPRISVGVILFSDNAHIVFNLQTYSNSSALLSAINNLTYNVGGSNTAEALTLLLSTAQNGRLGLRNDSSKVAIVITDGRSSSSSATSSAAAVLHASNIFDVYAVGVGGAYLPELQRIASSPEFVFSTNSFNSVGLQQLQEEIMPQLCNGKYTSSDYIPYV